MKKQFPKKPVEFGLYLIEYKDSKDDMIRFLKERIDTLEEAQSARDRLLAEGAYKPTIKQIG